MGEKAEKTGAAGGEQGFLDSGVVIWKRPGSMLHHAKAEPFVYAVQTANRSI